MSLFHHQRRSVLLAVAVVTTKLLWIVVTTASWKFLILGEIFNPPDADASVQPLCWLCRVLGRFCKMHLITDTVKWPSSASCRFMLIKRAQKSWSFLLLYVLFEHLNRKSTSPKETEKTALGFSRV